MLIIIPGKPIAKKRPRFSRRGKFVATYNDQETEEGRFLLDARSQITKKAAGPIVVSIVFCMPRPKAHYGTGKNAGVVKESSPTTHTQKPDTDNLIKFVLDCLNSEAWNDDAQIVEIRAKKEWAENGKTLIDIAEI